MADLIEELLKDEKLPDVRVMLNDRWLLWDRWHKEWVVRQQGILAPWASMTLYRGVFLIAAIEALRTRG